MKSVWQPNNPGSGPTGSNNFQAGYADPYNYWNLMNRTDYNISDKWKVFGRYNILRTTEAIQAMAPDATTIVSAVPTATPVAHCKIDGYVTTTDSFGCANPAACRRASAVTAVS